MTESPPGRADPSLVPTGQLLAERSVDPQQGLSSAEAARRLLADGPNALRAAPPVPRYKRLLAQFRDPVIYLLLAALSFIVLSWALEGFAGWPIDALVIAAIVILNGILGYLQEARASRAVAELSRLAEVTCAVCRDGRLQRVASTDLVRDDILVLAEGDAVGADARLIEANALRIQEATLTGESESVLKQADPLAAPVALGDRVNMVYKGTAVAQGTGLALVTATGMATEMGGIAALLEATEEETTPLQREVNRIGRTLAIAVLVIAAVVVGSVLAVSGMTGTAQVIDALLLGVSLAVAAVPEGLPAILSVVLALGVQRMSRHKAIMRKLSAVETLGAISVICTDKTGTLTRSEMMIVRAVTASGTTELSGSGYDPAGEVSLDGQALQAGPLLDEQVILLGGGCLASNADLAQDADGRWTIQGDPTEAAFLVAERKLGVHDKRLQRFTRLVEVPFTSDRKMMSTVQADHDRDDKPALVAKGAPDVLLEHCTHQRVGSTEVALDAGSRQQILAQVDELTDDALRPLAVAYRRLDAGEEPASGEALEHDLVYVGTVGIIDPPREEVAPAIRQAHDAGIQVVMITGDHPGTAARIARELGILADEGEVVTGLALDDLDDVAFGQVVRDTTVYARVNSAHKLRIVDALQAQGELVAMTGDGVNDAPALKSADIGIAMGITGTQVTREAARMILADDNFATIVRAVREGRGIFENIRKFLRYLLSSNMGEVLTVFLGVIAAGVFGLVDPAGGVALPLLVTQILWINLITDSGLALAMGLDRPAGDLMQRPPRPLDQRIIDAAMWRWVLGMGLVMALSALLTLDMYLPGGLIEGHDDLDTARTATFTVLVFAQLFNCLSSRSDHDSAAVKLFENQWLWRAIALSAALQVMVVQVGFFNKAFSTTPLSLSQWATCIGMATVALWFAEGRKWLRRLASRRSHLATSRES